MTPRQPRVALDWVLAVVALGFLAVVRAGVLQERDPYWQIRAGTENLAGAPYARPDSWSWAPVDAPFAQTSPLWNDILGAAWQAAGFAGFFTVGLLSIGSYGLVVLVLAHRLGARPLPALAGILGTLLLALPMLSPRGALTAQTLFLAAIAITHAALPRLCALPAVSATAWCAAGGFAVAALGIWLHLSWSVLAPALLGCLAVMLLLSPEVPVRRALVLTAGLAVGLGAGVVSGPYRLGVWALSRRVQEAASGVVIEWLPPWTPGLLPRWLPTAALAAAGTALALWWLWRHRAERATDRRVALVGALLVLAVPTAAAGFLTIRVIGVCLLTLAPVSALGATRLVAALRARAAAPDPGRVLGHPRVRHWMTARPWRVVVVAVLALVSPLVLLSGARLGRPGAELAALPALPQGCRLVSDANTAGPVLLLRPDVKVWIDTRADYWGQDRNSEAIRLITEGRGATATLERATCAILVDDAALPSAGLAAELDADPAWNRGYVGDGVSVWTKSG